MRFLKQFRDLNEFYKLKSNFLNQNAETISIAYRVTDETNADRTNPTAQTYTTEAGSYLPLSLPYPLDYQGNTYRIDGLQVGKRRQVQSQQ